MAKHIRKKKKKGPLCWNWGSNYYSGF